MLFIAAFCTALLSQQNSSALTTVSLDTAVKHATGPLDGTDDNGTREPRSRRKETDFTFVSVAEERKVTASGRNRTHTTSQRVFFDTINLALPKVEIKHSSTAHRAMEVTRVTTKEGWKQQILLRLFTHPPHSHPATKMKNLSCACSERQLVVSV